MIMFDSVVAEASIASVPLLTKPPLTNLFMLQELAKFSYNLNVPVAVFVKAVPVIPMKIFDVPPEPAVATMFENRPAFTNWLENVAVAPTKVRFSLMTNVPEL